MLFDFRSDLTEEKTKALAEIDRQAGEVRSKYITTVPGQELVYQQKEAEAIALSSNPDINPYEIPHIMAEANLLGITPMEVAIGILIMAEQWRNLSAQIEFTRLKAKADATAATDVFAVRAATQVDWNA